MINCQCLRCSMSRNQPHSRLRLQQRKDPGCRDQTTLPTRYIVQYHGWKKQPDAMAMFGTRVRFMQCHAMQIGYFRPIEKGRGEIMFHAGGPASYLVKLRINSPRHLLEETDRCILSLTRQSTGPLFGTQAWPKLCPPPWSNLRLWRWHRQTRRFTMRCGHCLWTGCRELCLFRQCATTSTSRSHRPVAGPFPVLDRSESSVLLYGRRGIAIRHRD